jgi:FAD/FMN-containing dehydrogenase
MADTEKVKAALAELQAFLGDRATDGMLHRMAYSRDWSPRFKDMADFPEIVAVPHDTAEVIKIVQVAGTNSGGAPSPVALAWAAVGSPGWICSTPREEQGIADRPLNMSVTVQAGNTIWDSPNTWQDRLWLPSASSKHAPIGADRGRQRFDVWRAL